jgi:hypothetical protein
MTMTIVAFGDGCGWATTTGWAGGLPWQLGHAVLPEPWQVPQLACVMTLPLPLQAEQAILPCAPQAPQASLPLPWHLLHWILTSRIFPTPTSTTSPVPLHFAQAKTAVPLQDPHASEPAPAQAPQLEVTATVPLAPQVPQPTTPEPRQVAHEGACTWVG